MGVLDSIFSAILGTQRPQQSQAGQAGGHAAGGHFSGQAAGQRNPGVHTGSAIGAAGGSANPGALSGMGASAAAGAGAGARPQNVDVEAVLTERAAKKGEKLNWRTSIVDLMKVLDLDSSLGERKELAKELGYKGELNGSAEMNMWLHKQVMQKLAANGGKVPAELTS